MSHFRKAACLICVAVSLQFGSGCDRALIEAHIGRPLTTSEAAGLRSIEQMIRDQWAGTGHEDRAVRIARCESGLKADPPHNNPHYGVFQMGRAEFAKYGTGSTFNAADNIAAAYRYWKVAGWGPWECRG